MHGLSAVGQRARFTHDNIGWRWRSRTAGTSQDVLVSNLMWEEWKTV